MEKIYDYFAYGENHKIVLVRTSYRTNNTLAIIMSEVFDDGHEEEWAVLTKNIDASDVMATKDDSAFVDTNNLGEDILKWLADNHIGYDTGLRCRSGFCLYPLVLFTDDALKEMRGE